MARFNVPTGDIKDPAVAPAIDQLENFVSKVSPYARFQYVAVTFNATANLDTEVPHMLVPHNPELVDYQVVRISAAAAVYEDVSASRRAWTVGQIVLRCNVASAAATLLLTLRPTS